MFRAEPVFAIVQIGIKVSSRVKIMLIVAVLVTVGGVVAVAMRPRSPREEFFAMRSDLMSARRAAETCSLALEDEQTSFDSYVVRVDAMRDRIAELEALDERGVPGCFVVTTEFEHAARIQTKALGFTPAIVWVEHPIQNRTPAELESLAEGAMERILQQISSRTS